MESTKRLDWFIGKFRSKWLAEYLPNGDRILANTKTELMQKINRYDKEIHPRLKTE